MPLDKGDFAYLKDMLDACDRAQRFVAHKSFDTYRADELLRAAVERQVQIIGEAARHVSEETKNAHPQIPWRPIMSHRHILVHEYGELEDELIWRVATQHVPQLATQLRAIVPEA